MLFYQFSKRFAWTPDQIRHLTLQECEHYILQNRAYEQQVPHSEVTLREIRAVLFSFLGVKDNEPDTLAGKAPQVTKEVLDQWYKDGMPSPPPWK